jgi:molecular chaperone DnaK
VTETRRFGAAARIVWCSVKGDVFATDRIVEASASGLVVATKSPAKLSETVWFEILDDAGERLSAGLGRVVRVDPGGTMGIELLSLGIDPAIVEILVAANGLSARPRASRPPASRRSVRPGAVSLADAELLGDDDEIADDETLGDDDELAEPPSPPEEDDEVMTQLQPLTMRHAGVLIGIDLGTTNTCAAHVVDGRPRILPGRTGGNFIPSMLTFDDGGAFHVGQRAADRLVLQPLRTVYGSKRLLGRTYSAEVAAEMQRHFAYPLAEADGQRFGVRIDGRVVSMDTIAARLLDEVRSCAEAHLGVRVRAAVITVPAYFTEVQRDAVRRAAREANLVVHRIVNEPTAAAVAYGHAQSTHGRVAIWDFGGGTFDFSILDVAGGELEVLGTGGDCFLGGSDFDDLIAAHVLGEFQRQTGAAIEPTPQQIARLREAADQAKRLLSYENEALVDLPEFMVQPRRDLSVELTRAKFEELARPLINRTLEIAADVMRSAKVSPESVDDVVLVGGTTRVPAVQSAVTSLFGRRPSKRINPDEAVALGAGLLADEIKQSSGFTLVDILPMSVGRGLSGMRFEPIVVRHSRLPTEQEVVVDADALGRVEVPLFQGESPDVSRNEYLCSVFVADRSLWENGRVVLRLFFDDHCVMMVDARDARTGRALPVKLDRSRPLEDVLRGLGKYEGPVVERWKLPDTSLGTAMGKLLSAHVARARSQQEGRFPLLQDVRHPARRPSHGEEGRRRAGASTDRRRHRHQRRIERGRLSLLGHDAIERGQDLDRRIGGRERVGDAEEHRRPGISFRIEWVTESGDHVAARRPARDRLPYPLLRSDLAHERLHPIAGAAVQRTGEGSQSSGETGVEICPRARRHPRGEARHVQLVIRRQHQSSIDGVERVLSRARAQRHRHHRRDAIALLGRGCTIGITAETDGAGEARDHAARALPLLHHGGSVTILVHDGEHRHHQRERGDGVRARRQQRKHAPERERRGDEHRHLLAVRVPEELRHGLEAAALPDELGRELSPVSGTLGADLRDRGIEHRLSPPERRRRHRRVTRARIVAGLQSFEIDPGVPPGASLRAGHAPHETAARVHVEGLPLHTEKTRRLRRIERLAVVDGGINVD